MAIHAKYDLHLHTSWSYDATADASLYFQRAQELGTRCIAITEHHNMDSIDEVIALSERYPATKVVYAAELSVTTSIGPVDLLCYNLPSRPAGALKEVFDEYWEWQQAAGRARSQGMVALGYDYGDEERLALLRTYRPELVLRRQGVTHVKQAVEREHFVARGYITSGDEYFELCDRLREVVPGPQYPAVERVVPAVKSAGGIVVIAHPHLYFLGSDRKRMDALREECSLDGIECAHPRVDPKLTPEYRSYCVQHGLLSTAGSDCHTNASIRTSPAREGHTWDSHFAAHIGEETWLDEFLERLG